MKLPALDPDLLPMILASCQSSWEDHIEFAFDDESIEHILYGTGESGPTLASIYGTARKHLRQIREASSQGNHAAMLEACAALTASNCPISIGMCGKLAAIFSRIVPMVPNPILSIDLKPLLPLLKLIWEIAVNNGSNALKKQIGPTLYRWFEHHGNYDEARRILCTMIEINAEQGNLEEEATSLNNLGFEYLLEHRFQEALPYFDRAAGIFQQMGEKTQHANSRANYLTCLFQDAEPDSSAQFETELRQLASALRNSGFWQERKPLILLARIREHQGRIDEAVKLVKKAIKSATGSGTRYPEEDSQYLDRLRVKLAADRERIRRSRLGVFD